MSYGRAVTVRAKFAPTVERVRTELQAEGFGVLTEIDVSGTMRTKLGVEMEDYVILGACNTPLAYQALQSDRSIGLLLPCNVVVRADDVGAVVEALDPTVMVRLTDNPAFEWIAEDAAARLDRVLDRLAGPGGPDKSAS